MARLKDVVFDWKEVLSGYNDGMADFAALDPKRLLTAYQIQLFDVDFAVKEVHRLAKRGARCVQITPFPSEFGLPDVHDKRYDPLWATRSRSCSGSSPGRSSASPSCA